MKRHNFGGKVTWKSVTCKIFLDIVNNFLEEGELLHCLRGDGRPCLSHSTSGSLNRKSSRT